MNQKPTYPAITPALPVFAAEFDAIGLDEARRRFAELLGLDEPVSEAVLIGAIEDPLYAMHLFASRDVSHFFDILIANPPRSALQGEKSATELLKKFSKSMLEWSHSGFKRASKEVVEARINACLSCQHLKAPSGSILQKIASAAGLGDHRCGLCGCMVEAKAQIATEKCPARDPLDPNQTPWTRAEAALE